MDPDKLLPSNLVVKNADKHLYRNGLSFTAISDEKRRNVLFKPLVIFTVLVINLIKYIILTQITDDNSYLYFILGDFDHFLGISNLINIILVICDLITICTQLVYFYGYKSGKEPTFLRLFQMLSGTITPRDVGLTDEKTVMALIRRSDLLFKNTEYFVLFSLFNATIICFIPLVINFSLKEVILYAIPNHIILLLFIRYLYSFLVYQMVYLYLICYYLKSKIRAIDRQVIQSIQLSRYQNLRQIIQNYYQIYSEINEYNTTFWSKYLFVFWLSFGSVIVMIVGAKFQMNCTYLILKLLLCCHSHYIWYNYIWHGHFQHIISEFCGQ